MKEKPQINPYAIYVYCDGSMLYKSKNLSGVGFYIDFPENVPIDNIEGSKGAFSKTNIVKVELQGLIEGMKALIKVYEDKGDKLNGVDTIIVVTDRFGLNEKQSTHPSKINNYRKNKWKNDEGKPIKNEKQIDEVDKLRRKLSKIAMSRVTIEYFPRKYNKEADKLSRIARNLPVRNDKIATNSKIGKRKYKGDEITYKFLRAKDEMLVHVFRKDPVQDEWEINVDICDGTYKEKKMKIYTDNELERRLHRHHIYLIKIKDIFRYHVRIFKTTKEVKLKKI